MAQKNTVSLFNNPGMVLVISYVSLFALNAAILYLANRYFPQQIVLGTVNQSPLWAVLHSMGVLALIDTFAIPFVRELEQRRGQMWTTRDWLLAYFGLNFAGIWLLSRFNDGFALGISAWYVAAILALVLDFAQGILMMRLEKLRQAA